MEKAYLQGLGEFFAKHDKVLLLAPKNIDGDTIGTNVAVYAYLKSLGKEPILYSPVPLEEKFLWMPHVDEFVFSFDPKEVDAIFTSDTAVPHLFMHTPDEEKLFQRNLPWVNLDHHISNSKYGTIHALDYSATSCSMILYDYFEYVGAEITPAMATHMLMSIYMDSGSFIHPNTKERTYMVAGKLMERGADAAAVGKQFFLTNSVGRLKLWGIVLERMQLSQDGILMSMITEQDFAITGTTREDIEGLVDMMNTVENRVCVLLSEDGKGNVKGSLRTMAEDVDVNQIARQFGGGGHRLAAGFTLQNTSLERLMSWNVLGSLQE